MNPNIVEPFRCTYLAKNVVVERWDCLRSTKGGKRGDNWDGVYDINPCFCPFEGYCKNMSSGGMQQHYNEAQASLPAETTA